MTTANVTATSTIATWTVVAPRRSFRKMGPEEANEHFMNQAPLLNEFPMPLFKTVQFGSGVLGAKLLQSTRD
jgi:hypothetical protein